MRLELHRFIRLSHNPLEPFTQRPASNWSTDRILEVGVLIWEHDKQHTGHPVPIVSERFNENSIQLSGFHAYVMPIHLGTKARLPLPPHHSIALTPRIVPLTLGIVAFSFASTKVICFCSSLLLCSFSNYD